MASTFFYPTPMRQHLLLTLGVFLVLVSSLKCKADDEFVCCMSGMKTVNGVALCHAPCCPGYREVKESPPLLAPVVYCQRDEVSQKRIKDLVAAYKQDIRRYYG